MQQPERRRGCVGAFGEGQMSTTTSNTVLREKLSFDEQRERKKHLDVAIGFRAVARQFPDHAPICLELMRKHALLARKFSENLTTHR